MTAYHNHGAVLNQIHTQQVHGDVTNNYICTGGAVKALEYNLGVRFGLAPQIDEDYFVGREQELGQLQTWLNPTPGKQNIVALHGMGGVGKTQLSVHFVRKSNTKYSAVFWLNAKDEQSLKAGLAALAIEVSDASVKGVEHTTYQEEQLLNQARRWLSLPDNNQWLLVYDNYDDPRLPGIRNDTGYDIRTYFPLRAHGSILITTRSSQLRFGKQLAVEKFEDVEQSLLILAAWSGRATHHSEPATKLVQRLDGLPLALATAGTYLKASTDSFDDYLQLYNTEWNELQCNNDGPEDYEERTLYSTWNVSFQRVQQQDPAAAELLALMAYFDNQDLWYEFFAAGHELSDAPGWWTDILQNRPRFQRVISLLLRSSLVKVHQGRYSLHPCVHDWTLEHLNHEFSIERYRIAAHCIACNIDWSPKQDYWIQDQRVLPHARRLDHHRFQAARGQIYNHDHEYIAILYARQGMHQLAERLLLRVLAAYEDRHGIDHTETLRVASDLGKAYTDQANLLDAERVCKRSLDGYARTLGAGHEHTIRVASTLALIYIAQQMLVVAEDLCQHTLAAAEEALGVEHEATFLMVSRLGKIYENQGRLVEAEQMMNRALNGYRKAHGPEHSQVLYTLEDLARLFRKQGRLKDAERTWDLLLATYEKVLGADASECFAAMGGLGDVYKFQGRFDQAKRMYDRALHGFSRFYSESYPENLEIMIVSAKFSKFRGKIQEAQQTISQVIDICVKAMVDSTRTSEMLMVQYMNALSFCTILNKNERSHAQSYMISLMEQIQKNGYCRFWDMLHLARALLHLGDTQNLERFAECNAMRSRGTKVALHAACDACSRQLNSDVGINICQQCVETDLCDTCISTRAANALLMPDCEHHHFYDLGLILREALKSPQTCESMQMDTLIDDLLQTYRKQRG